MNCISYRLSTPEFLYTGWVSPNGDSFESITLKSNKCEVFHRVYNNHLSYIVRYRNVCINSQGLNLENWSAFTNKSEPHLYIVGYRRGNVRFSDFYDQRPEIKDEDIEDIHEGINELKEDFFAFLEQKDFNADLNLKCAPFIKGFEELLPEFVNWKSDEIVSKLIFDKAWNGVDPTDYESVYNLYLERVAAEIYFEVVWKKFDIEKIKKDHEQVFKTLQCEEDFEKTLKNRINDAALKLKTFGDIEEIIENTIDMFISYQEEFNKLYEEFGFENLEFKLDEHEYAMFCEGDINKIKSNNLLEKYKSYLLIEKHRHKFLYKDESNNKPRHFYKHKDEFILKAKRIIDAMYESKLLIENENGILINTDFKTKSKFIELFGFIILTSKKK